VQDLVRRARSGRHDRGVKDQGRAILNSIDILQSVATSRRAQVPQRSNAVVDCTGDEPIGKLQSFEVHVPLQHRDRRAAPLVLHRASPALRRRCAGSTALHTTRGAQAGESRLSNGGARTSIPMVHGTWHLEALQLADRLVAGASTTAFASCGT